LTRQERSAAAAAAVVAVAAAVVAVAAAVVAVAAAAAAAVAVVAAVSVAVGGAAALRLDDHHSVSWKNMNQVVRLVAPGKLFPNSVSVENNVVESDAHSNAERGTAFDGW